MKTPAHLTALPLAASLLSGCAAMFSSSDQTIPIRSGDGADLIFVNGADSVKSGASATIRKERKPVQLVVSNGKFRDEQFILMQYSMSPWHFFSWVPWILVGAPAVDYRSTSAYGFPSSAELKSARIPEIASKGENPKRLKVVDVTAELSNRNISAMNHQYSDWISHPEAGEIQHLNTSDKFTLTDLVPSQLNALLEKKGLAAKGVSIGKGNSLNLSAELQSIRMHYVNNPISMDKIVYADLTMDWKLANPGGKTVASKKFNVTSGQFIFSFPYLYDPMLTQVVGDGIEKSLYLFLNEPEADAAIRSGTPTPAAAKRSIRLAPSKKYVSSIQQAIKSSVTIKDEGGHGSGFIVSSDGYIVTNCHVIDGMDAGKVVLHDNSVFDYEVVQYDSDADLALIKIDASGLTPFKLQKSRSIAVTSDVYAVGTPASTDLAQTVSKGIVSGVRTDESGSSLIQTDASVNSGNSGGALVDPKGLVVGVVSSKLAGFGVEGVAFGIPAYEILDRLKVETGY